MLRSGIRVTAVTLALIMVLAACTARDPGADQSPATEAPGASTTASGSPGSSSSATASPSAQPTSSRPLQPVPSVKPPGFVAPPAGSGVDRYLDQPVRWQGCGALQCTTVRVPLDWTHPDGQAITLALAKRVATATPRLGSLFVNPGGPGGSGISLARNLDRTGLERYDIVGWDPRGTGESTPVQCQGDRAMDAYYALDFSPDTAAEDRAWIAANAELGRSCLARSGALLQHVSTLDTVRDLELLRQLLGNRKLDYVGFSYGTEIGAVYANAYPTTVGRMVLDGAVDITGDDRVTQADGFERALAAYASWCADQRSCSLGRSQAAVQRSVIDLLRSTDATPIKVGTRSMTQALAVTGLLEALYYDERVYPYLTSALVEARSGQGAKLLALADSYNQRGDDGGYGSLLTSYFAITCTEETGTVAAARSRAAAAAKSAPVIGPFFGIDYTCSQWPVAPEPPLPKLVARGAAPILVLGTTNDPATPYEQAVSMAKQLESGVLITRKGEGHTAYGRSDCVTDLVRRYLVQGSVPRDGTTCG